MRVKILAIAAALGLIALSGPAKALPAAPAEAQLSTARHSGILPVQWGPAMCPSPWGPVPCPGPHAGPAVCPGPWGPVPCPGPQVCPGPWGPVPCPGPPWGPFP
jgi:hypothetical protein